MKSFLVRGKRPIIKWGMLPDGIFYEGAVPEGFSLAVCPSEGIVIIDVDRHGKIDGFDNIPNELGEELASTLSYPTKNDGRHYWFKYTGTQKLANKASGVGIDLRTNKGYVVWYPKYEVRNQMLKVKSSTPELNKWLESLFGYVNKDYESK
jgi:hypothetical protein